MIRIIALILTLTVFNVNNTLAQSYCQPHDIIVEQLKQRFGEVRFSYGIDNSGTLIETFVNPDNNTFTIIGTRPQGMACVMVAGKDYTVMKVVVPGQDL